MENLNKSKQIKLTSRISVGKSLMAEWLEQASQWQEMYCHDLEVMSSNPDRVELGVAYVVLLS